jgi:hypothetical protein
MVAKYAIEALSSDRQGEEVDVRYVFNLLAKIRDENHISADNKRTLILVDDTRWAGHPIFDLMVEFASKAGLRHGDPVNGISMSCGQLDDEDLAALVKSGSEARGGIWISSKNLKQDLDLMLKVPLHLIQP